MPDEMIIRHCAPTLAGMKTGNMFTYHFKDASELRVDLFVQAVKAFKRPGK